VIHEFFNSELNVEESFFICDLSCTEIRKKIYSPFSQVILKIILQPDCISLINLKND
jgi:hypothetical protein